MFMELLLFNSFTVTMTMIIGLVFILSMFGFIGNINISSGDGNINISGTDVENELIEEKEEVIDAADINKLVLENPLGNVKVHVIEEPKIKVIKKLYLPKTVQEEEKNRIKGTFNQPFLKKNANTAELTVPKMAVMSIMTVKVDMDIMLPAQVALKHLAGVNDIDVDGVSNDVDLTNNVGNMNLKNLSGKLIVHTNSGNIIGNNIKNPVSITANAGDIRLKAVDIKKTTEKLHSNVGKVEVDVESVEEGANCKIDSNTGEVLVLINYNENVSLEASTNVGQLDVDSRIDIISKGSGFMGGSIVGVINKPGGKLCINSSTGKVEVKIR